MIVKKYSCTIPDYPTEIKLSEKRAPVYWKSAAKLPKKYRNKTKYDFSADGFLIDKSTGDKVIKNIKTVGEPRMMSINAQRIYVGLHPAVRSKIVNQLHELFHKEFKKQLPPKIDLKGNKILIGIHFHDIYTNKLPDLDNLANLFVKCGIDCLTTANNPNQIKGGASHKLGIIPDDKIAFIQHILIEFTNITNPKDRKLDFTLFIVSPNFSMEELLNQELACKAIATPLQP